MPKAIRRIHVGHVGHVQSPREKSLTSHDRGPDITDIEDMIGSPNGAAVERRPSSAPLGERGGYGIPGPAADRDRVLAVLKGAPDGLTLPDIARATGFDLPRAGTALGQLLIDRRIQAAPRGGWRVVKEFARGVAPSETAGDGGSHT